MQVENLELFCDLIETQSFTRAAEKNHITHPAGIVLGVASVLCAETGRRRGIEPEARRYNIRGINEKGFDSDVRVVRG
jgi:hypothetical protein